MSKPQNIFVTILELLKIKHTAELLSKYYQAINKIFT